MGEDDTFYLHLLKLSSTNSEEAVEHLLTTLWNTRKTGLAPPQKSHFYSLLNLPSIEDLDLVVACLRSLIRKSLHENFDSSDVSRLFPSDLSSVLQGILISLIEKYRDEWKEDVFNEQVKRVPLQSFQSSPCSEISTPQLPQQEGRVSHIRHGDLGASVPSVAEMNTCLPLLSVGPDCGTIDSLETLPHVKSMTWTMESLKIASANRVAVVTLKLQDHTQAPSGEIEVKFQLTKDAVDALLRSMTCISEQLSSTVGSSSEPLQKKQKQ